MNPYIEKLIRELKAYEARCEYPGEVSAVDILWEYFINVNPPDDGSVKAATDALRPVHQALPIPLSDDLSDLVMELTCAYMRSAFLEGIRIGMTLKDAA